MNNKKLVWLSVLNSFGVLAYVSLLVAFMSNSQRIFGKDDNAMIGVVMLLIFIFSALVTGSLVLGRPILLYLDGKKSEALKLLFYTMAGLFAALLLAIFVMLLLK